MKKQQTMVLSMILIISIVLISSIFFYKKESNHKSEINKLLQAEDMTKKNNYSQYSLTTEYKKNKNNKDSKDFITDIENKQQSSNGQVEDVSNIDNTNFEHFNNTNSNDTILLARLIYSEAGDEPYEGKIAVANVVLYRSQKEKESIKDVIYAPSQFDGVNTSLFSENPDKESLQAATQALSGKKVIDRAYYFANLNLCNPSWAKEKTFLCRIGDHWFFKE